MQQMIVAEVIIVVVVVVMEFLNDERLHVSGGPRSHVFKDFDSKPERTLQV